MPVNEAFCIAEGQVNGTTQPNMFSGESSGGASTCSKYVNSFAGQRRSSPFLFGGLQVLQQMLRLNLQQDRLRLTEWGSPVIILSKCLLQEGGRCWPRVI